jgi:hypothetical protein
MKIPGWSTYIVLILAEFCQKKNDYLHPDSRRPSKISFHAWAIDQVRSGATG